MDENFETPETSETTDPSLGKEIAKTLAISTATSAGVLAGFVVVGLAVTKLQELKEKRAAKKAAQQDTATEN